MKFKNILLPIIIGIFTITTTSCISNAAESDDPISIVQVGDVTFKATQLSPSMLKKRHGKINNPYIGRPKGFAFDTVIFELEISSTETTLFFDLTKCQLNVEGNTESADNSMRFMADWEAYTLYAGDNQLGDFYAMRQTVEKTMLPNKVKVTPEKPVKGYIAFTGMFPRGLGETTMKIPAYTLNGDEGNVKISFFLKEQSIGKSLFGIKDKKEKDKKEKPGNSIFDKQKKPENSILDKQEEPENSILE